MASDAIRDVARETKMELAPMIDVTFLLLVFFLCSIQYKVLEGRLPAYLPRGVSCHGPMGVLQMELDIRVERQLAPTMLGLDDHTTRAAWDRHLPAPEELRIQVQDKQVANLIALRASLQRVRDASPRPAAIAGPDGILGTEDDWADPVWVTLTAKPGVLYSDIICLIDVILEAGFRHVTFLEKVVREK